MGASLSEDGGCRIGSFALAPASDMPPRAAWRGACSASRKAVARGVTAAPRGGAFTVARGARRC